MTKIPVRRGVMRTEVLAIIVVGVFLAGIMIPFIVQTRSQSRQATVKDRLRTIGSQFQVYHDTFQSLPTPAVRLPTGREPSDSAHRSVDSDRIPESDSWEEHP